MNFSDPANTIGRLPLEAAERQRLLYAWNDTESDYPRHATVHDLVAAQAARTPDRIAVTFEGDSLTYAQLEARSNQLAHYLRQLGVGLESLVGLYVERSLEMVIGMLGIMKAGGAYVPMDPDLPDARVRLMLADARPSVVLTYGRDLAAVDGASYATIDLGRDWPRIAGQPVDDPAAGVGPENLIYVIYTSGSSGTPKGVQIIHRSAVNLLYSLSRRPGLGADDHLLAVTTLSFDPTLYETFLPLIHGARVTVAPGDAIVDGPRLQRLIEDGGITFMRGTPTNWRILLESGWQGKADLKIISGGEALTPDLAQELLARCASLWNHYGPTETTVTCTVGRVEDAALITLGAPVDNTHAYILDEHLEPLPVGEVGRLYIAGDGIARGYLNRPELTAERFSRNPFSSNGSAIAPAMYWTGDLAYRLPDGRLVFAGRDDFQVKVRGFRIELGEIEAAIRQHPAISQNLVMAREDVPGDVRLVAYLVPKAGRTPPDAAEMRLFLGRTLPDYMVPARFVVLDRFPVSPTGKIDRRALPAPDRAGDEFDTPYVAPRNEGEAALAVLFAEVLNLERVSVEDSFFDLGGNSLLAARLIYRVQDAFGVKPALRDFFARPSVAGLSEVVAAVPREGGDAGLSQPDPAGAHAVGAAAPNPTDAILAQSNLTRNQFLMWLGQQMNPDVPLYNVVLAFTIHGALNEDAFGRAFQALVDHHDAFRTVFRVKNGVPYQTVLDTVPATLERIDFSQTADPDEAYRAFLEQRKMRLLPLDAPLFDAVLVKLADDRYVWYLGQHHIMTDAISAELTFERLAEYYQLAQDDRLGDIAPPPQFGEFVGYERALRQTPEYQQSLAYWRDKYGQPLPPTEFYGRTAPEAAYHTERVVYQLGEERSAKLRAIAQEAGFASPSADMSLFTLFATLLFATTHRISGQRTLRLGTPFHGRPTSESLDIIGLFIEMGALQVDIGADESFATLGDKVMAETLEGLGHVQPGMSSAQTNNAFDMVLNFVQASFNEFAGLPVTKEPVHTNHIDAAHNLRLQIIDYAGSGSFTLLFDLKTALFGPDERAWLVEHFVRVLDAFIANPTRSLGDFSLMSEAEREALLVEFNATDTPYPADRTVVALFEEQVARTPAHIAVVDGDASLSYDAFNRRANRLARFLRAQGAGPGAKVAICMPRTSDVLVAIWGVLKAGAAYVPIDPAYPRERVAFMVADAGPDVLLATDVAGLADVVAPAMVIVNPAQIDLTSYSDSNLDPAATPEDLAYMIYTSGSTGRPKGAMITHRGLVNYAWWARRVYQDNGPLDFPLYSSLSFDLTVTSLFVPFLSGGKIVVYGESAATPGLEILSVLGEDQVDIVKLTPSHLGLLREMNLANLRIHKLIVGGEDFKTDLARDIQEMFGGEVRLYNEYGPTEATVACMLHEFDPETDTALSVPIGTPAANARIYLLDEYDQPVPPGVIGEMVISSDGVARGYHNRPELTAERFGDDPFRPGARFYRTGDIARWNTAGQMVFLGRRDHQVKVGGARIELGEVESTLRAHSAIKDVVVSVVQFERHLDENEIVYCTRCGLPSSYPDISFNDDGVCNLCTDFDTFREDVFRYFKTKDDLLAIVEKAKAGRSGDYDCMMLYSGGKDSTYVLSQLVEMGLNVLAFSLDNGYISEEAKENVRRVTRHLGVDLVFGTTPHMNAIFNDSLERFSNVCQGCYKVIYTLSMKLAREKGIQYIFTGLSRGQLFETRLDDLFRRRIFEVARMDEAVLQARKVYHRVDDAVKQLLDVSLFADDQVFADIQFVDYFRYSDVEIDEIYGHLATRVPWIRPRDTGRSTNCLINEAGIFVHKTERGYHNYALPYSWDVRLGHKTREEVMHELDDDIRPGMVNRMLDEVGYTVKSWRSEQSDSRLAAYYVADDDSLTVADLRAYLSEHLPAYMIPAYFVRLAALPLTPNGKVDRQALPSPTEKRPEMDAAYVAPQTELESQLAEFWSEALNVTRIGIYDDFFDLGGASIAAVQVVVKISETYGVAFPINSFFEQPTIAGQSAVLEELLIAQLEAMSDEEAAALLADMGD